MRGGAFSAMESGLTRAIESLGAAGSLMKEGARASKSSRNLPPSGEGGKGSAGEHRTEKGWLDRSA